MKQHILKKVPLFVTVSVLLTCIVFSGCAGRTVIEGLRTDSLWLIPGVIRVSQLLAAASFVIAGGLYIINAVRIKRGLRPLAGEPLAPDAPDENEENN